MSKDQTCLGAETTKSDARVCLVSIVRVFNRQLAQRAAKSFEHIRGIVVFANGKGNLISGTVGAKVAVVLVKEHMLE